MYPPDSRWHTALLTPLRFAAVNLDKKSDGPQFEDVVDTLADDEKHRMDFLKACLTKLGLKISEDHNVPSLSRIHLSSLKPADTPEFVASLHDIITTEHGDEYIKDENDTFHILKPSTWKMDKLEEALPNSSNKKHEQADSSEEDRIVDYNSIIKRIVVHETEHPSSKTTPYFNHHAFYSNLEHYRAHSRDETNEFGKILFYGEVVTSTNTILEK